MAFPPRKPRHDEPTGEELQEAAAAAAAGDAAAVVVNEDGSITLADGSLPTGPAPQRWTGGGVKPDGRYNSLLVSKFVNCLMYDGKKVTAEAIFYGAMKQIADKLKADPLPVFEQALENVKPLVEVRSKRIGGANYQVPVEGPPDRREARAGTDRLLQQDRYDHPEA
jgi:ribosomal protein S7